MASEDPKKKKRKKDSAKKRKMSPAERIKRQRTAKMRKDPRTGQWKKGKRTSPTPKTSPGRVEHNEGEMRRIQNAMQAGKNRRAAEERGGLRVDPRDLGSQVYDTTEGFSSDEVDQMMEEGNIFANIEESAEMAIDPTKNIDIPPEALKSPETLYDAFYNAENTNVRARRMGREASSSMARNTALRAVEAFHGPEARQYLEERVRPKEPVRYMRGESQGFDDDVPGDLTTLGEKHKRINEEELWREQRGTFRNVRGRYPKTAPKEEDLSKFRAIEDIPVTDVYGKVPRSTELGENIVEHKGSKYQAKMVTPSELQWYLAERENPESPLSHKPWEGGDQKAAQRRQRQYWNYRAQGLSADESLRALKTERRGRSSVADQLTEEGLRQKRPDLSGDAKKAQQMVFDKGNLRAQTGRAAKYGDMGIRHEDYAGRIAIPAISSTAALREKFPNASEATILKYQQIQREAVDDQTFNSSKKWAHESRQKLPRAGDKQGEKVTVFTTNLGRPNVTLPAESAAGQYFIKKRKKMLFEDKAAPRQALRGTFPDAVRDQHLIDIAKGYGVGFQGRGGVYHQTGWKKGSKRSPGYKKSIPVGTEVLRDSTGAPVFDERGNVVYTEGYTRPVDFRTKYLGLRVFMG